MEKYRSSADPSTGIHPFIPSQHPRSFVRTLLRPILFIIRLPLLVFVIPYFFLSLLALLPLPYLPHLLRRLRDTLLLPPLLLSLGIRPRSPHLERPRVRAISSGRTPSPADLIFVNHASPLDILYLQYAYSPIFTTPCGDALVCLSTVQALSRVGCAPSTPHGRPLSAGGHAPIVVLAEGCSTNARGVLRFPKLRAEIFANRQVFALGFTYSRFARETLTIGSVWLHLLHLMTDYGCFIRARIAAVSPEGDLQASVAALAAIPPMRIDKDAGHKFLTHWRLTHC